MITIKTGQKYKSRLPSATRKLMAKKHSLWRRYKDKRCEKRKQAYVAMAKKCKRQMETYELEAEEKVLKGNNLGNFYRFVNMKLNSKSGVGRPAMQQIH